MALPSGGLMTAGRGEQAAAAELVAIRAERASQDLRTSRDYVLRRANEPGRPDDKFVDSRRGRAWVPTKLCDWLRGELAKW